MSPRPLQHNPVVSRSLQPLGSAWPRCQNPHLLTRQVLHPPTPYLLPLPHPAPPSPAAHQTGWAPGASARVRTGPAAGTRTRRGGSGGRLHGCSRLTAPCPVQEGYRWVPRKGVKGREKGPCTIPERSSARSAGEKSARCPEQHVETCPPGAAGGPCVCMFTEGREGRGPAKPQDDRPLPRARPAASPPTAAGHLGRPRGQGQTAWLSCQLPWRATPQSCPCETCHLQAGAPGQAGWGQGAGSGLRLDQDHCPAVLGSGQTPYLSPQRLGPPSPGERKRVQPLLPPPGCPTVLNQACGLPLGQSPRSEPHHPQLEVTEQAPSQG